MHIFKNLTIKARISLGFIALIILIGGFIYFLKWSGYGCTSCTNLPRVVVN